VSTSQQTSCPHCHASFTVKEEQLQSADGKVRCGVCLRVFDGRKGEAEFVAPVVAEKEPANPFMGLFVQPMENAELNLPPRPAPLGLKILLLTLAVVLAGQIGWHQLGTSAIQGQALTIAQLVVRAHPEHEQTLAVDAILDNSSNRAQPYPALFLYLDNRYGERRGQRLFLPAEYLPSRLVETGQLPAHTRVQVSLAVHDPGQGAVNYGVALQPVPTAD